MPLISPFQGHSSHQTIIDMPTSPPSQMDEHDDSSPSIRTNPLDLDPATTSFASIPTSHLINENVEPIARLQHERVVQELKRMSSLPLSPVLIPARSHSGRRPSAGYVSPLPMDESERERQLASPLPQQEHTEIAPESSIDIILSSPAFAMGPTSSRASTSTTTVPLTTSNLAQHDRIVPPVHHAATQSQGSSTSVKTQTIPAYHSQ